MKGQAITIALAVFSLISLVSVIVTVVDKSRAIHGEYRVPEATLIFIAAIGGSAAMYLTMLLIRHKTRHIKFMLGIPIIILFQLVVIMWLAIKFEII